MQAVFHESRGNVSYVSTPTGIQVRPVTIGRYTVENVQILEGLFEGETVLLSRPSDFKEATKAAADDRSDAATADAKPRAGESKAN